MSEKDLLIKANSLSQNAQGQQALYGIDWTSKAANRGKIVGYADVIVIDGHWVVKGFAPKFTQLKAEALKVGLKLRLDAGFRTWIEQFNLRKQNVLGKGITSADRAADKLKKQQDFTFLVEADNGEFYPRTGKPGESNHQLGDTADWQTKDDVTKQLIMSVKDNSGQIIKWGPYEWLVKNAFKFGWVRTVPDERWHWTIMPTAKTMFDGGVKRDHPSWDGLI